MISITQTKSLMGQRLTVSLCVKAKGQQSFGDFRRKKQIEFVDFCPPELSLMRIHYLNGIVKVERRGERFLEKYATKSSLVWACKKYGLDFIIFGIHMYTYQVHNTYITTYLPCPDVSGPENLKKSKPKNIVKSNKSISRIFF